MASDAEVKLAELRKKYQAELATSSRLTSELSKAEKAAKRWEARAESLESSLTAANARIDSLEKLSRELKRFTSETEAMHARLREEEEARLAAHNASVAATVEGVQKKINEISDAAAKTDVENAKLRQQLAAAVGTAELLEKKASAEASARELEGKLGAAIKAEADARVAEAQGQLDKAAKELALARASEAVYREQLEVFGPKLAELQAKFNASLDAAKKENETLLAAAKRAAKDRDAVTVKLHKAETELVKSLQDQTAALKKTQQLLAQNKSLSGLCRALQEERGQLRAKLVAAGLMQAEAPQAAAAALADGSVEAAAVTSGDASSGSDAASAPAIAAAAAAGGSEGAEGTASAPPTEREPQPEPDAGAADAGVGAAT